MGHVDAMWMSCGSCGCYMGHVDAMWMWMWMWMSYACHVDVVQALCTMRYKGELFR